MSRPWWETTPRKYWAAEDHRAARRAGVPEPPQPANLGEIAPLTSSMPQASLPGGLYGRGGASLAERRSAAIDARLRALGLRTPRRRTS